MTPTKIDDGGPAFPLATSCGSNESVNGMSLRDWFAGQALAGLLAHPECTKVGPGYEITTCCLADESYACADAMLAARKEVA